MASKFQQRHYETLAALFGDIEYNLKAMNAYTPQAEVTYKYILGELIRVLAEDSERFSKQRFINAVNKGAGN